MMLPDIKKLQFRYNSDCTMFKLCYLFFICIQYALQIDFHSFILFCTKILNHSGGYTVIIRGYPSKEFTIFGPSCRKFPVDWFWTPYIKHLDPLSSVGKKREKRKTRYARGNFLHRFRSFSAFCHTHTISSLPLLDDLIVWLNRYNKFMTFFLSQIFPSFRVT